jgi:hypothetical protein
MLRWVLAGLRGLAIVTGVAAVVVRLDAAPPSAAHEADALPAPGQPVLTSNPVLQQSLDRLENRSPSWREAIAQIRGFGRRVIVLTPDQVVVRDAVDSQRHRPFDQNVLAEVSPVVEPGGVVRQVVVVINLPMVEAAHHRRRSAPRNLHDDLDRILAHEVYGHALPYLLAGHVSGACADPKNDERPADACAIQRENTVRAELALGQRTDAGMHSLALARAGRH